MRRRRDRPRGRIVGGDEVQADRRPCDERGQRGRAGPQVDSAQTAPTSAIAMPALIARMIYTEVLDVVAHEQMVELVESRRGIGRRCTGLTGASCRRVFLDARAKRSSLKASRRVGSGHEGHDVHRSPSMVVVPQPVDSMGRGHHVETGGNRRPEMPGERRRSSPWPRRMPGQDDEGQGSRCGRNETVPRLGERWSTAHVP